MSFTGWIPFVWSPLLGGSNLPNQFGHWYSSYVQEFYDDSYGSYTNSVPFFGCCCLHGLCDCFCHVIVWSSEGSAILPHAIFLDSFMWLFLLPSDLHGHPLCQSCVFGFISLEQWIKWSPLLFSFFSFVSSSRIHRYEESVACWGSWRSSISLSCHLCYSVQGILPMRCVEMLPLSQDEGNDNTSSVVSLSYRTSSSPIPSPRTFWCGRTWSNWLSSTTWFHSASWSDVYNGNSQSVASWLRNGY